MDLDETLTRREPCSFRDDRPSITSNAASSSVTTTHDRAAHRAQHHSTNVTTPPEAQMQHYEDYDARSGKHHHRSALGGSAAHAGQGHALQWKGAVVSWQHLRPTIATRAKPLLTVHGNALGVPAGCRLIFCPQAILNRRQCISTTSYADSGL